MGGEEGGFSSNDPCHPAPHRTDACSICGVHVMSPDLGQPSLTRCLSRILVLWCTVPFMLHRADDVGVLEHLDRLDRRQVVHIYTASATQHNERADTYRSYTKGWHRLESQQALLLGPLNLNEWWFSTMTQHGAQPCALGSTERHTQAGNYKY